MMASAGPSPFTDPQARQSAGMLGIRLFLVSLGMLFGACLIGYLAIRFARTDEPLADLPPLPAILWLSTLLLLLSSGTMQWALASARRDRQGALRAAMVATTLLGFGFLAVQAVCWIEWADPLAESLDETQRIYVLTSFYVLTGIHAVHVIGGLIPLLVVSRNAFRGRYGAQEHAAVQYCGMYWHFLDAVWVVLFVTLMVGMNV